MIKKTNNLQKLLQCSNQLVQLMNLELIRFKIKQI